MLRSRAGILTILGLLVVMTGVFTATMSENSDAPTTSAGDAFILVNGDAISEDEFISRVATVEQNMVMLSAHMEVAGDDPFASALIEIMDETSPETIALASLILDMAVYQEALRQGHQPDLSMIEQQVEQERQTFEMIEESPEEFGVDQGAVDEYRATIDGVGEEQYWSEYFPQLIEQQTAVQQFRAATGEDEAGWIRMQQSVFHNAEVYVQDPEAIAPATFANAGRYLDSIWELSMDEAAGSSRTS